MEIGKEEDLHDIGSCSSNGSSEIFTNHPLLSEGGITSFLDRLAENFTSNKFCDVRLYPGVKIERDLSDNATESEFITFTAIEQQGYGSPILAHKLILDHASPYFRQVFALCDKGDKALESLQVPGVDHGTLKFLIHYIYTGDTTDLNSETMPKILHGAKLLQLEQMERLCWSAILGSFTSLEDCMAQWKKTSRKDDYSNAYDLTLLKCACEYMFSRFEFFVKKQQFLALSESDIVLLIKTATEEKVDEEKIFQALTSWVQFHTTERHHFLPYILQQINLETVPVSKLKIFFRQNPVVSSNARCQQYYLDFLENMVMSRTENIPQNFVSLPLASVSISSNKVKKQEVSFAPENSPPSPVPASRQTSHVSQVLTREMLDEKKNIPALPVSSSSISKSGIPGLLLSPVCCYHTGDETKVKFKDDKDATTLSQVVLLQSSKSSLKRGESAVCQTEDSNIIKREQTTETVQDHPSRCGIQKEVDCLNLMSHQENSLLFCNTRSSTDTINCAKCKARSRCHCCSDNSDPDEIVVKKANTDSRPISSPRKQSCKALLGSIYTILSTSNSNQDLQVQYHRDYSKEKVGGKNDFGGFDQNNNPREDGRSVMSIHTVPSEFPARERSESNKLFYGKSDQMSLVSLPPKGYTGSRRLTRCCPEETSRLASRMTRPSTSVPGSPYYGRRSGVFRFPPRHNSWKTESVRKIKPLDQRVGRRTECRSIMRVFSSTSSFDKSEVGAVRTSSMMLRFGMGQPPVVIKRKSNKKLFPSRSSGHKLRMGQTKRVKENWWLSPDHLRLMGLCVAGSYAGRYTRYLLFVEDPNRDSGYLVSYDLQTEKRLKLTTYPYDIKGNCFLFHQTSLYDLGGVFHKRALSRVEVFDFVPWQRRKCKWRPRKLPVMNLPRYGFRSCILEGYLYVIGGFHTLGAMNLCERLGVDVVSKKQMQWQHIATMHRSRGNCGVAVYCGKIYALGGVSDKSEASGVKLTVTNSVEYYDAKTNCWSWCPGMQLERSGLCAVVLHNRLYAIGGCTSPQSGFADLKLSSVEVYDEEKYEWVFCSPMLKARENFSVFVMDDYIYAYGGDDSRTPTVERYDDRKNEWNFCGKLPPTGQYHAIGFADFEFLPTCPSLTQSVTPSVQNCYIPSCRSCI